MQNASRAPSKLSAAQLPPFDEKLRYSVPEASAYLRQSPAKTWLDIKAGRLTPIRDAGRCYIPGTEIVRRCSLRSEAA